MASPDPRTVLFIVIDHREGLGIVNDHQVMTIQVVSDHIFIDHFLIDIHLPITQIDVSTLERVVHLLRDAEKVGGSLDYPPACLDAHAVHQKRQRCQKLSHPTSIIGRVDIGHMEVLE